MKLQVTENVQKSFQFHWSQPWIHSKSPGDSELWNLPTKQFSMNEKNYKKSKNKIEDINVGSR